MKVLYQVRPYEKTPGSAEYLFNAWMNRCKRAVRDGDRKAFRRNLVGIAKDFEQLEVTHADKIKVGLVGEIMVKYHPAANNDISAFLEQSGAELIVPGLCDFFLYCALIRENNYHTLDGGNLQRILGNLFIKYVESYRKDMRNALRSTSRFKPTASIYEMATKAGPFLSLCNQTGEGWLLTAEIVDLIENGANCIVCMQPFACLPNHISGRGMIKPLKEKYPNVNIIAIDYDSGASSVNQINRIRLLLENSKMR